MYRLPYTRGELAPYAADTGCDISMPVGTPVIAVGSGLILYSEGVGGCGRPHTPWTPDYIPPGEEFPPNPRDTPGCILLLLDQPIHWASRTWTMAWYCHLSRLALCIRDGIDKPARISAGMMIGHSGTGRSVDHLHFGLIDEKDQADGHYLPPYSVANFLKSLGGRPL